MMRVLVTGADGFVGRSLVRRLLDDGREVTGAVRPGAVPGIQTFTAEEQAAAQWVPLELGDPASVTACLDRPLDAVVHLAGVASGTDALADAGFAWMVNAAGTARLVDALAQARRRDRIDPIVLVVSTAEVYGRGTPVPRRETDSVAPLSPYAASKLGGEVAALEAHRRTGLRVVVVRPFPHTGPGQDGRFVVPAFAERLCFAKRIGAPVVKVGNLEPVREFLHVQDVVDAYARLLTKGQAGEVYNVASGVGIRLDDLLFRMADVLGVRPIPEADPELMRPADIPYLVGDAAKLRTATGWTPRVPLEETLRQVLDAASH
jgi:GDP-4-dehydro-6-deoxy-D-mannose reductase